MLKILKKLLYVFDLKLSRASCFFPHHLSDFQAIKDLIYTPLKNGVVINVDVLKGRSLPCFGYGDNSIHPYVIAAKYGDKKLEKIESILKSYYRLVNPSNAMDVFGLKNTKSEALNFPYWAVVMPWDFETQIQWQTRVEKSVLFENKVMGKALTIEHGWAWMGPTSDEKANIEARRLHSVLTSIVNKGYQRSDAADGDIQAVVLINEDDEWVWQSVTGQHRAASIRALGFEQIPIRVERIIRRSEVSYWPNVRRGLYTVDEALRIFDCIFDDNFDHLTIEWKRFIHEQLGVSCD